MALFSLYQPITSNSCTGGVWCGVCERASACVSVRACVHVCVRACVRERETETWPERECVCVCVCVCVRDMK